MKANIERKKDIELGKKNIKLVNTSIPRFPKNVITFSPCGGPICDTFIGISTIIRFKFQKHYWCTIVKRTYYVSKADVLNSLNYILETYNREVDIAKNLSIPSPFLLNYEGTPLFWIDENQKSDAEIYRDEINNIVDKPNKKK